ncbi:MAG: alpha-amylase [Bacilli bacterium]|nr:alpha-amylase [Bacilli bacterium]
MLKGNEVIYQIFVRNYSVEGTFKKVEEDLPRIKDLGVDIIYLMPINEIGEKNRKGTYGSPYASKDYFSVSKNLGTLKDLKSLIQKIHKLKMKIIVDMVFNHTAPDSILYKQHPEFYYMKNGKPGNRVGEWSDIIDLDTSREDTQEYLLSVLKYWINVGFDGFRFDVASMIDFNLFKKARSLLGGEIIFLAESIDDDFAEYVKKCGINPTPDYELFPIFDCCYNYSWYRPLEKYLKAGEDFDSVINNINRDLQYMPKGYLRCNCIENHDCERMAFLAKDKEQLIRITKLSYYLKGCVFIYAGQEYGIKKKPDLFAKDPINWNEKDLDIFTLHKQLINEKHNEKVVDYNICVEKRGRIVIQLIQDNDVVEEKGIF